MARQKGMLNLSGNLEPTVTATGDTYRLVDLDVTQESSWVLDGGSGGQTIQVESMPLATESDLGKVLQYIGTTDLNYTNGYFYKCVYKNSSYLWEQQNVQPDAEGQTIQVDTMPTASAEELGKIYQYIGQDGGGALHGYFYECVALHGGGYGWLETEVSAPTEELSSSDMADVKGAFSPVIESVGGLPILFDEGGTERQVGWYRYANGTKKPVYEKCIKYNDDISVSAGIPVLITVADISSYNIDEVVSLAGFYYIKNAKKCFPTTQVEFNDDMTSSMYARLHINDDGNGNYSEIQFKIYRKVGTNTYNKLKVTIRYTKTTDTPA